MSTVDTDGAAERTPKPVETGWRAQVVPPLISGTLAAGPGFFLATRSFLIVLSAFVLVGLIVGALLRRR